MAGEQTTDLNEPIPGGRYLAADGKTLVNANGEPIKEPEAKPAKAKAPAKGDAE